MVRHGNELNLETTLGRARVGCDGVRWQGATTLWAHAHETEPGHKQSRQAWWAQQPYKNRVLFLSGSRDTFQKAIDAARQTRALQSIENELKSEATPADDPQWRAQDALRDRIALQFSAALKEAFDQIVYLSINTALRATGVDLAFAGNRCRWTPAKMMDIIGIHRPPDRCHEHRPYLSVRPQSSRPAAQGLPLRGH